MFEMLGIAKVDPTQCGFPISRSRQYLLLALSSSGIKLLIIDVQCCWVVVCAERYVLYQVISFLLISNITK